MDNADDDVRVVHPGQTCSRDTTPGVPFVSMTVMPSPAPIAMPARSGRPLTFEKRLRHHSHRAAEAMCGAKDRTGDMLPGMTLETCDEIRETGIATIRTDMRDCKIQSNETNKAGRPLHWMIIPAIDISMGEIFYRRKLTEIARDRVQELFFAAPPLHLSGGTESPIDPSPSNDLMTIQ